MAESDIAISKLTRMLRHFKPALGDEYYKPYF